MDIIIVLVLLQVKHFIADFWLQFPYMIEEKGTYLAEGGRHHALVHTAGTFLTLAFVMSDSVELAVYLAFLDGFIHYHIDWAKQQLNRGLTVQDRMFWFYLGLDQGLHYLTYIAIVAWINI